MRSFSKTLKAISLVTIFCFVSTQISWGAPAQGISVSTLQPQSLAGRAEVSALNAASLAIPTELGQVTDTMMGDPLAPTFIHIQSAHGNYQAEKNIEKLLGYIEKNSSVKLLLLEGAGNKLQPELFRLFPKHPDFNKKVTDKLMQEGYLTGPESFLIESTDKTEGWGIEDLDAYKKDRDAFISVVKKEKTAEKFLGSLRAALDRRFSSKLNKDLLNLVRQEEALGVGTVSFESWIKALGEGSRKHLKTDLSDAFYQDSYPFLIRYFRLQAIGSKIDREKARREADAFLSELGRRKVSKEILDAFKTLLQAPETDLLKTVSRTTDGYSMMRRAFDLVFNKLSKDFSMAPWPNWMRYAQYIILMQEMEGKGLQEETVRLKEKLLTVLARTADEKEYLSKSRELYLLRRLFSLELTRAEYEELCASGTSPVGRSLSSEVEKVKPIYEQAIQFYAVAVARENKMFANALKRMNLEKKDRAVIVTGGFHTDGLKKLAVSKHCSYLQITPRINEVSKRDHDIYLKAMMGSRDFATSQAVPLLGMNPISDRIVVTGQDQTRAWRSEIRGLISGLIHSEKASLRPSLSKSVTTSTFGSPTPASTSSVARAEARRTDKEEINPRRRSVIAAKLMLAAVMGMIPLRGKAIDEISRIPALVRICNDESEPVSVRYSAQNALGAVRDPAAVPELINALSGSKSFFYAQEALREIPDRSVTIALKSAFYSQEWPMFYRAFECLVDRGESSEINDSSAIPRLRAIFRRGFGYDSEAAAKALYRISKMHYFFAVYGGRVLGISAFVGIFVLPVVLGARRQSARGLRSFPGAYRGGDRDYAYDRAEWESHNSFIPLSLLAVAGNEPLSLFIKDHQTAVLIFALAGMITCFLYAVNSLRRPQPTRFEVGAEALRSLRALMRDEDPSVCARAVEQLAAYAKAGSLKSFRALIGAFYDDAYKTGLAREPISAGTKALIVSALAEFDSPAVEQLLNDAVTYRSQEISKQAAESLEAIKSRKSLRSESRSTDSGQARLTLEQEKQFRKVLSDLQPKWWDGRFNNYGRDRKSLAKKSLRELKEHFASALDATLKDQRWDFRYFVAIALGELKDPRAIPVLSEVLHGGLGNRSLAVHLLSQMTDEASLEALLEAIKTTRNDALAIDLVKAMGVRGAVAVPMLIEALGIRRFGSNFNKAVAAQLGVIGDLRAVSALMDELYKYAGRAAAEALRKMGDPRSEVALKDFAEYEKRIAREEMERAEREEADRLEREVGRSSGPAYRGGDRDHAYDEADWNERYPSFMPLPLLAHVSANEIGWIRDLHAFFDANPTATYACVGVGVLLALISLQHMSKPNGRGRSESRSTNSAQSRLMPAQADPGSQIIAIEDIPAYQKILKDDEGRAQHMVQVENYFRALTRGDFAYFLGRMPEGTKDATKARYRKSLKALKDFFDKLSLEEQQALRLAIRFHDTGYSEDLNGTGHEKRGSDIARKFLAPLPMAAEEKEMIAAIVLKHMEAGPTYLGELRAKKFLEVPKGYKGYLSSGTLMPYLVLHVVADAASLDDRYNKLPLHQLETMTTWLAPKGLKGLTERYDEYRLEMAARPHLQAPLLDHTQIKVLKATISQLFGAEEAQLRKSLRDDLDIILGTVWICNYLIEHGRGYRQYVKFMKFLAQLSQISGSGDIAIRTDLVRSEAPELRKAAIRDAGALVLRAMMNEGWRNDMRTADVKRELDGLPDGVEKDFFGIPVMRQGNEIELQVRAASQMVGRSESRELDLKLNPLKTTVIAMDGASATGKGTVARKLAQALGYKHIELGVLNRAVAEKALNEKLDLDDAAGIESMLARTRIDVKYAEGKTVVFRDGVPLTESIRSPEVGNAVALVSRHSAVLRWVFQTGRELGEADNMVIEGRNVGADVFPDTPYKFFLTADPDVRAKRRMRDFEGGGKQITLEQVKRDLLERDRIDSIRPVAPFRKAADAVEIDNTNRSAEESAGAILQSIREKEAQQIVALMAKRDALPREADLLVIFGSPDSEAVAQEAAKIFFAHKMSRVIVSGRFGKHIKPLPEDPDRGTNGQTGESVRAEALVMKDALVRAGVPAEAIWVEKASQGMTDNGVFSVDILKRELASGYQGRSAIFMHAPLLQIRGSLAFRGALSQAGIATTVYDYAAPIPVDPARGLQEILWQSGRLDKDVEPILGSRALEEVRVLRQALIQHLIMDLQPRKGGVLLPGKVADRRMAAAKILGGIKESQAIPALKAVAGDPDLLVRDAVLKALSILEPQVKSRSESRSANSGQARLTPEQEKQFQKAISDLQPKWCDHGSMISFLGSIVMGGLVGYLMGSMTSVVAGFVLGTVLGGILSFRIWLWGIFEERKNNRRVEAINTLGVLNDPRAIPILIDILGDENPHIRWAAITRLNDLAALRELGKELKHKYLDVRIAAAQARFKLQDLSGIPVLVEELKYRTGDTRPYEVIDPAQGAILALVDMFQSVNNPTMVASLGEILKTMPAELVYGVSEEQFETGGPGDTGRLYSVGSANTGVERRPNPAHEALVVAIARLKAVTSTGVVQSIAPEAVVTPLKSDARAHEVLSRSEARTYEMTDTPLALAVDASSLGAKIGTAIRVAANTVSPLLSSTPAYASEIAPELFAGTRHFQQVSTVPSAFAQKWPVFNKIMSSSATASTERMVVDQRQGIPDAASVLPLVTFARYNPKAAVVLALIAEASEVATFEKELAALSQMGALPQNFAVRAFANENEFVGAFASFYNSAAPLGQSVALITDREDSVVTRKIGSRRHLLSVVGARNPLKQTASTLLAADKLLNDAIWSMGYHFVSVEKLGGLESLMAELANFVATQSRVAASA